VTIGLDVSDRYCRTCVVDGRGRVEREDARPELRLTRRGDELVRRLLIEAAHYTLGPFGPDSDLRRFGLRLLGQGGKRAKKRAVVAVARKLATLLHRLSVTGEVYHAFGAPGAEARAA
jgi:hypothetical protein